MEDIWAITWDDLMPGIHVDSVIQSALEADVGSIYRDPWFTRLWIVQEVSLSKHPLILCSGQEVPWKELELATRVFGKCIQRKAPQPEGLRCIEHAWDIMIARSQYGLNTRSTTESKLIQMDQQWSLGNVAWHSRSKHCKDDRDRAYAMLSLISAGNSLKVYVPEPFTPNYKRSVEWAYGEFWLR